MFSPRNKYTNVAIRNGQERMEDVRLESKRLSAILACPLLQLPYEAMSTSNLPFRTNMLDLLDEAHQISQGTLESTTQRRQPCQRRPVALSDSSPVTGDAVTLPSSDCETNTTRRVQPSIVVASTLPPEETISIPNKRIKLTIPETTRSSSPPQTLDDVLRETFVSFDVPPEAEEDALTKSSVNPTAAAAAAAATTTTAAAAANDVVDGSNPRQEEKKQTKSKRNMH